MGVQYKQQADGSVGLEGPAFPTATDFIFINIPYNTASPLTLSGSVLPRRCIVQSIQLNPDVASTNAVTVALWAAGSTVALASGTALHTGTGNLQGTANAVQVLTLSTVTGALQVNGQSRIGAIISGALGAAGSGVITIGCVPL